MLWTPFFLSFPSFRLGFTNYCASRVLSILVLPLHSKPDPATRSGTRILHRKIPLTCTTLFAHFQAANPTDQLELPLISTSTPVTGQRRLRGSTRAFRGDVEHLHPSVSRACPTWTSRRTWRPPFLSARAMTAPRHVSPAPNFRTVRPPARGDILTLCHEGSPLSIPSSRARKASS